jgi:hypothetical protein
MPAIDEIQELINNTTQTFIDLDGNEYSKEQAENGVIESGKLKGVKFTGSNGNSIFIPAAGLCYESLLGEIGMSGRLWSSGLIGGYDGNARNLGFSYGGYVGEDGISRYCGSSVRGVKEPYKKYLTFKAEEDNSSIRLPKLSSNQTMEYSTDTVTWNTFDTTTNISLNTNEEVYIRGVLSAANDLTDVTQFKMGGKIAAYGNCNALWNYEDLNAPLKAYCGYCMFFYCTSLTTAPDLPATALAEGCYAGMFGYCTSLATAPELPATTLADLCYNGMFAGCTSLVTAPELPARELPATTLAEGCYAGMFYDCTNLNYIKCLATDISSTSCVAEWVNGVASTGTFIKHPNMNDWTTGYSGIPEGWIVENAVL